MTSIFFTIGEAKVKRVNKPLLGHFEKADVIPKRLLSEFRVTKDCLLEIGTKIKAVHFVPGQVQQHVPSCTSSRIISYLILPRLQLVDVCGTSKGKGFAGAMKRHNFGGGAATHGNSLSHRILGSTG